MPSKPLIRRHVHKGLTRGQTLAEYALVIAFISVVAIASLLSMGGQVSSAYGTVSSQLNTASDGGPVASGGRTAQGH